MKYRLSQIEINLKMTNRTVIKTSRMKEIKQIHSREVYMTTSIQVQNKLDQYALYINL